MGLRILDKQSEKPLQTFLYQNMESWSLVEGGFEIFLHGSGEPLKFITSNASKCVAAITDNARMLAAVQSKTMSKTQDCKTPVENEDVTSVSDIPVGHVEVAGSDDGVVAVSSGNDGNSQDSEVASPPIQP